MKVHEFAMDLTPDGRMSCVLLNGEDISNMLTGIEVKADVSGGTTVTLFAAKRQRANLIARVPEAQIIVVGDA